MQTIIDKTRTAGKLVGMGMSADKQFAATVARMGVQWIQCGDDFEYMAQGVEELYPQIRNLPTA